MQSIHICMSSVGYKLIPGCGIQRILDGRGTFKLKSQKPLILDESGISFLLVCFVFNPPQDPSALKTLQIEKLRSKLILRSDSSNFTRSHSRTEVRLLCSWAEFPHKTDFCFSLSNSPPFQLPRSWQAVSCSMICESRCECRLLLPCEIKLGTGAQHEQ